MMMMMENREVKLVNRTTSTTHSLPTHCYSFVLDSPQQTPNDENKHSTKNASAGQSVSRKNSRYLRVSSSPPPVHLQHTHTHTKPYHTMPLPTTPCFPHYASTHQQARRRSSCLASPCPHCALPCLSSPVLL
ncbi:uncharacterized protein BKA78DRAFT_34312 [Phyllosticta capitalensis]|uniref:uncharacterized protein n=1 Tax=Phyllosticta capitalensis TaxID=121624 RepID=UPI0031327711